MICKKCLIDKEEKEFITKVMKSGTIYTCKVCTKCYKKNLSVALKGREYYKKHLQKFCLRCGIKIPHYRKYCSRDCANKSTWIGCKRHSDESYLRGSITQSKHWLETDHISNQEKALASALADEDMPFIHQYPIRGMPDFFAGFNISMFCDGVYYHVNKEYFEKRNIIKLTDKHRKARLKDYWVTRNLENKGYIVLRFWETDILDRIEWCVNRIKRVMNATMRNRLPDSGVILLEDKTNEIN